jgi:probable phosphoglycerate mutase
MTPGTGSGPPPEDMSRATHVVLVRHGLPLVGVSQDPPLSPEGLRQAHRAGDWLRWESPAALISSPYVRAAQTAAPIGLACGLGVETDDDLREWSAEQPAHYVTPEQLADTDRGRAFKEGRFADFVPEHDAAGLTKRMTAVVTRAGQRWPGRTVVLVSHGGAINNLFADLLGLAGTFFFDPGYTSLSRLLVLPSGRMVPVAINSTAHLVAVRGAATSLAVNEGAA